MHNALKNATISRVSHTWKEKARAQRVSLCGPETSEQPMCCADLREMQEQKSGRNLAMTSPPRHRVHCDPERVISETLSTNNKIR